MPIRAAPGPTPDREPDMSKAATATPAPLVRVVDDEPAIRSLFAQMAAAGGFEVVVHGTGTDLLAQLDEQRCGCLVLDLMLPDVSGIQVLQQLADRGCQLPVVFMSGMASVQSAVKALKLGSIDFLEKPFDVPQMLVAIQRAIQVDTARRRTGADEEAMRDRFLRLTRRESEVMEQVVHGAANKAIAANLGLSPKTVEVHRANVMRKTEASSLAELVRMHVAIHS